MTKPMAEVIAESLYDRGINVPNWPADEAAAYRDNGGFMSGKAAVEKLRYEKAGDALKAAGYGDVADAKAQALEDFAVMIVEPGSVDQHIRAVLATKARNLAAVFRHQTLEELAS